MYKELGLETLKTRRWLKKLCFFYKIKNNGIPSYLAELIPSESHLCNTWNTRNIITYSCRNDTLNYYFFPWMINGWNKLNFNIQSSSFNIFRANLIKILRPIPNSIFSIFNPLGLKLIRRLQLGFFFYHNIYYNVQTNNLQSTKINQNNTIKMSQMINITLKLMQ